MRTSNAGAVEKLNNYWDALVQGCAADGGDQLEGGLADVLRQLHKMDDTEPPSPAFARRLRADFLAKAGATEARRRQSSTRSLPWPSLTRYRRWLLAGLAAASLLLVLGGLATWATRPQPVSAQSIIEKAQATATDLAADGVRSFEMTQVTTIQGNPSGAAPGEPRSPVITEGSTEIHV